MLAFVDPALYRLDLFIGQSALADEVAVAAFGFPRWHITGLRDEGYLLGAGYNIGIVEQAEGRRAFWAVAGGAVLENYGGDIAIEGRLCSALVRVAAEADGDKG